jgi:uncharacterized circularly permuted ATP-grasp superfamily protein
VNGYDEAYAADGTARAHYEPVLAALYGRDLEAMRATCNARMAAEDVRFGADTFAVDPVPRLITADEARILDAGLGQRARALNAFVADAYGERAIVAAGIVPEHVIDDAEGYEPDLRGNWPGGPAAIAVAGLDVVREPGGDLVVLEDNVRTPSGFTYAQAAATAVRDAFEGGLDDLSYDDSAGQLLPGLLDALRGATSEPDPTIVVLTDGPSSAAHYEHATTAQVLGLALVELGDLRHHGDRLQARDDGVWRDVDVVYRRSDEDRLRDDDGTPTAVAQALLGPWRAGTVALVNGFGTGVADDKLTHAYVEDMIRFYAGEEPLLRSVRTLDLDDEAQRTHVLDALGDHVIKPRFGHGGEGIVVCAHATEADQRAIAATIRERPREFVAQATVWLSHHPTVIHGALEPRHIDLRPFVFSTPATTRAVLGGLTRVAWEAGALVVNSSQQGGAKATWVLR